MIDNEKNNSYNNSIIILHIHKEFTEELNLSEIEKEFVGPLEHCLTLFGKFLLVD